jgi:hypothetical protein
VWQKKKMVWQGQKRAEMLMQVLVVESDVVAFVAGYVDGRADRGASSMAKSSERRTKQRSASRAHQRVGGGELKRNG